MGNNGLIYFIQHGENGPLKIGFTRGSIKTRLNTLQVGNPVLLSVVKVVDGTPSHELDIHDMFGRSKIRGEWFEPTPELLKFIDRSPRSVDADREGSKKTPQPVDIKTLIKEHSKLGVLRGRPKEIEPPL
jgi:hypothetical protein